ncbi:MAG: bifunctional glutamate N-acetyltransferase/amino-acid acetyltransferase ArgJ [Rhodospirillales bacterium]|nr:bifunctional glutamate N-acetyltransferase/amino-acid acetyltransferase ArgJ [Rhodospirillales bacterium]
MIAVSPLAPADVPELPPIPGVRLATASCAVRYEGRDDVLMVELAPETAAAGVLTRSATASAPVLWCRRMLRGGRSRALLVNSGNANAFTGEAGDRSVERLAAAVSEVLNCRPEHVLQASTGVIGEPLPDQRISAAVASLAAALGDDGWERAASAIMTTDTFPKAASRRTEIDGVPVTINGIAKGSGMIAPDMATMLAFVFTDAQITPPALQALLTDAAERTFNCITVDSDTSTSDTLLMFATGAAGHAPIADAEDARAADFRTALGALCLDLAHKVVRDGEGASKFVTITVTGAEHHAAAKRIALAIANSPLVKTAIAGEDANWGRIVMAVGKSGERADRDRIDVRIGGVAITHAGARRADYDEGPVAAHMRGAEIDIAVDVGVGGGRATVWTCDLTHAYIDINAHYRS